MKLSFETSKIQCKQFGEGKYNCFVLFRIKTKYNLQKVNDESTWLELARKCIFTTLLQIFSWEPKIVHTKCFMALLDTSWMKVESRMSENASILSFYILVIFWEWEDRYALSLFAHLDTKGKFTLSVREESRQSFSR